MMELLFWLLFPLAAAMIISCASYPWEFKVNQAEWKERITKKYGKEYAE